MPEIIDLTTSPPPPVIIEVSSDGGNDSCPGTQEKKKRKSKKRKASSSTEPPRAHSPVTVDTLSALNAPTPRRRSASPLKRISAPITDEPGLFFFDGAAAPIAVEDSLPPSGPVELNHEDTDLLLPSHVAVLHGGGTAPVDVIPPPAPGPDDEDYIEYLDYEDRKAPGLVRYFDVQGEESNQPKPSVFKCKNCGAEGDHKTYECPIQICLTCGARDEHSTRSCPISKTCYSCGMKGHVNKMCPNPFSRSLASPERCGDCDRCGSTEHKVNECPTLWRIYQYVNDEERIVIKQSREEKKQLAVGKGQKGYIGAEVWCYNCANTGHLGDDCNELQHPVNVPTAYSAFSAHNIMSGPFYDPATEPVPINRGPRELQSERDWPRLPDDWDADVPIDVGKRGKNKDKERLEQRFREQEDEGEDWFLDAQNVKRRGMGQKAPPRGKTLKFGMFKDGGHPPPSLPTNGSGPSLLARLSDTRGGSNRGQGGRDRHEPSHQSEKSIRIRGAATDYRKQGGRYANARKSDWERDKPGQGDHGPRYRGGYDR